MADYVEHGHSSSFLQGDTSADSNNAMRRSITRGSHNSHASASASTRSWVMSNQMNPPPAQLQRSSSSGLTSFHGPRPLPEPQSVRRTPVRYPTPAIEVEDEDREEDRLVGSSGMQQPQEGGSRDNHVSPTPIGNTRDRSNRGGRSLIGGLMSGIRRLPTALRIGGGQKSKKRIQLPGSLGTENTSSPATDITRGNTLPRYLSNPSIGPSNPQFAHRLSIAVASGALPPDASPTAFQTRPRPQPNPADPLQPNGNPSPPPLLNHPFGRHRERRPNAPTIIRVTPPSANDIIAEERISDHHGEHSTDHPQLGGLAPSNPNTNLNDTRTTFMVYNSEDSHESQPTITPPTPPANHPRVSYVSQPTPRASGRVRDGPPPLPTMPTASPPMSPPRAVSSVEGPKDILSPISHYTTTTMASHYDPSFASHLTPIEKFFKGLYNLPWIARERVTVDYRPGDSNRAKLKVKGGVKRPMSSWYRTVVSRSRRGSRDLDLLGNGTESTSASTSLGNSIASPASRRSGRSSNHNRYQTSPQNHRHRKTRRRGTTLTDPPQRNISPLLPPVYPYQYPPLPFAYPYGSYPPAPMPLPVSRTAASPPRGRRGPKYPHGYAPYQPMPQHVPPPPPMFFIAPSPPLNNEGQGGMQMTGQQGMPQGPVQVSPVVMQYVPGGLNQHPSPPITPRRTTAPQSQ